MAMSFRIVTNHTIVIFLCFVGCFQPGTEAPIEDEVIDLPGLPYPPIFRHYSGYLEGNEGRHLHYW